MTCLESDISHGTSLTGAVLTGLRTSLTAAAAATPDLDPPEQLFSWLTSSGSKIHGVKLVAGGPRVGYGLLASQVPFWWSVSRCADMLISMMGTW